MVWITTIWVAGSRVVFAQVSTSLRYGHQKTWRKSVLPITWWCLLGLRCSEYHPVHTNHWVVWLSKIRLMHGFNSQQKNILVDWMRKSVTRQLMDLTYSTPRKGVPQYCPFPFGPQKGCPFLVQTSYMYWSSSRVRTKVLHCICWHTHHLHTLLVVCFAIKCTT